MSASAAATTLANPRLGISLAPLPGRMFVALDPPATHSPGGVVLPDTLVLPVSTGTIVATGARVGPYVQGERVMLVPATGTSLAPLVPRYDLPPDIIECSPDDVLATVTPHAPTAVHPDLPAHSVAHTWCPIPEHLLLRPWSPAGVTPGGILWAKNTTWPRVWGWVLVAPHPHELRPGAFVLFDRFADETIGYDTPHDATQAVVILHEKAVRGSLDPPITLTFS